MPLKEAKPSENPSDDTQPERAKPFKFKRKHKDCDEDRYERQNRRRHHHHHRIHRSKRSKSSHVDDDPSAYDDSVSNLPPDVAFRESLFDAMGDDEGAEFWQGVYGQPIHDYPNKFHNEETGELEQLNDEEYATYVRRKMWERSWEGVEAAREEKRRQAKEDQKQRKDRARSTKHEEESQNMRHDFLFDLEIEESLKRGKRRKDKKKWQGLWQDYLQRWSELLSLSEDRDPGSQQLALRNKIPWPVESGKRKDLDSEHIESFLRGCADAIDDKTPGAGNFQNMLKAERIRFHPDKIQQRYGFMEVDQSTMQGVTAVFQVFDRMWNEQRGKG